MSRHDGFSHGSKESCERGETWEENFYREMLKNVRGDVLQDVLKELKKDSKLFIKNILKDIAVII